MLNAKQAREKAVKNRIEITRKDVEKLINQSVSKGRNIAKFVGVVPPEIILELVENGYHTEECGGVTTITW